MTDTSAESTLVSLFVETANAHHQAFESTDGEDPDWPIWYADYIRPRVAKLLDHEFTKTELVVALVEADNEHRARAADTPWADVYADLFCERFQCLPNEQLSLYYMPSCPFCRRVLRTIEELGIEDIELRNIWEGDKHRADLVEARGRATVPVLRCTSKTKDRWMPESADIDRYLRERFGS